MVALSIHLTVIYVLYKYYSINHHSWPVTNFFMIFYMIEIFLFLSYFDTQVYIFFLFLYFGLLWLLLVFCFFIYFFTKMLCMTGMIFANKTLIWWDSFVEGLIFNFYSRVNKYFFNDYRIDDVWYSFQLSPRKYRVFRWVSFFQGLIHISGFFFFVYLALYAFQLHFIEFAVYIEMISFWVFFVILVYKFISQLVKSWYFKTNLLFFGAWSVRFDDESGFLDYMHSDQYVIEEILLSQQIKGVDFHQFLSDMDREGVIDPNKPEQLMSWDNPETYGRFHFPVAWVDYYSVVWDRPVTVKFTRLLARSRDTFLYYFFVPSAIFTSWTDVDNLPNSPDYENNLRRFI